MSTISNILKALAATSSRKTKESIFKAHQKNDVLKNVFLYAYDPRKKYYLRKVDMLTEHGDQELTVELIKEIFDPLDNREVTGHAALHHFYTVAGRLCGEDYSVVKMILEGDLDVGASISTINKIWPNSIYVQPYMRCALPEHVDLNTWDWADGIFVQLKEDGMWGEINSQYVTSRPGNRFDDVYTRAIQHEAVRAGLGDYAIHGEFLIEEDGVIQPREVGNGIMNSISKGGELKPNQKVVYSAWDMVNLKGDKRLYEERFAQLAEFVVKVDSINLIEYEIVHSKAEAWAFYRKQLAKNKEGAVIKTKTGLWIDGTSKDQVKLKVTAELDLEVVGFKPGNGKFAATFGSITLKSKCGKLMCNVSGMPDKTRKEIHAMRDEMPGKIVTVKANGIMHNEGGIHSLFLCRFSEVRNDKTEADDYQRIKDIFNSLMNGDEA